MINSCCFHTWHRGACSSISSVSMNVSGYGCRNDKRIAYDSSCIGFCRMLWSWFYSRVEKAIVFGQLISTFPVLCQLRHCLTLREVVSAVFHRG